MHRTELERKAALIDMHLHNNSLDLEELCKKVEFPQAKDRLQEIAGLLRRARAMIRPFMYPADRKAADE